MPNNNQQIEGQIDGINIYIEPSNDSPSTESSTSNESTASTKRIIDTPFGKTNTKTVTFYAQLVVSGAALSIATAFCATGIIPVSVFTPMVSAVVFAWLPCPSL